MKFKKNLIIMFSLFFFTFSSSFDVSQKIKKLTISIKKLVIKNKKLIQFTAISVSMFLICYLILNNSVLNKNNQFDKYIKEEQDNGTVSNNTTETNFNFDSLIENNDDKSIELRKKIENILHKEIGNFITFIFKKVGFMSGTGICYNINIIGECFKKGFLNDDDKIKIKDIYLNLDPFLQKILKDAILKALKYNT